ncbi:hypothetical protein MKX01_000630 [Papaver californicum]|nr:hypothetical protein MKX01_000630 [Papaver californicum]
MEFFFGAMNGGSQNSECQFAQESIQKCPFLRNINEPTNFAFAKPMNFSMPARGAKGPIFEDGPNFDMAFRVFHGNDGVVPLSGRSYLGTENLESESKPVQFNPLAAKAASISLSSAFGPGGPFGFDFFNKKFNSKSSKNKNSSKGGNSSHEAVGNEWLEQGNCPIAKSYRAVSGVLPLVAKALQPPPGMKFKCPPAIVAARAALARTALVKTLRPQALSTKMLAIGMLGMAANVPLGIWREHTEKFSVSWFAAVHAAVPFIAMLRKSVLMPKTAMAFTIGASILGQVIGSRAERIRLKKVAAKKAEIAMTASMETSSQLQAVGASNKGGQCGEIVVWDPLLLNLTTGLPSSSSGSLCY